MLDIIVPALWILFDVLICLRTGHMTKPFRRWEWWTWLISGVLLAFMAVGAGAYSRHQEGIKMDEVKRTDDDTNRQVHFLVTAAQARQESESIADRTALDTLKRDALALGATLLDRSTQIKVREHMHGPLAPQAGVAHDSGTSGLPAGESYDNQVREQSGKTPTN